MCASRQMHGTPSSQLSKDRACSLTLAACIYLQEGEQGCRLAQVRGRVCAVECRRGEVVDTGWKTPSTIEGGFQLRALYPVVDRRSTEACRSQHRQGGQFRQGSYEDQQDQSQRPVSAAVSAQKEMSCAERIEISWLCVHLNCVEWVDRKCCWCTAGSASNRSKKHFYLLERYTCMYSENAAQGQGTRSPWMPRQSHALCTGNAVTLRWCQRRSIRNDGSTPVRRGCH
jgi:hypothetical protein